MSRACKRTQHTPASDLPGRKPRLKPASAPRVRSPVRSEYSIPASVMHEYVINVRGVHSSESHGGRAVVVELLVIELLPLAVT